MNEEEKKINKKIIKMGDKESIIEFMVSNNLKNKSNIGDLLGISRERVRQIFSKRDDISFKEIKKEVTLRLYQNDIFKNSDDEYLEKLIKSGSDTKETKEIWKLIDNIDAVHDYFISNKGKVSRRVFRKKNGINYPDYKIMLQRKDKIGNHRVSLQVYSNENKSEVKTKTVYVHRVVAEYFLEKNDENLKYVKYKDKSALPSVDNLYWSNRNAKRKDCH